MLGAQWIIDTYKLTLGESLVHTDKKYGEVYKCTDQHGKRHLVRVMSINQNDESLMKYYQTECDIIVFGIFDKNSIVTSEQRGTSSASSECERKKRGEDRKWGLSGFFPHRLL